MANEQNEQVVRKAFEAFSTGDMSLIDESSAEDSVTHDPALPDDSRGPEGFKQVVQGYRTAFPDLNVTVDEQIAEGDRVCTRWTARGTHGGEFFGAPATNKQATVTGMTIDRVRDGQIVESRTNWDALGLMQQLGLVSMPMPSPAEG